MNRSFDEKLKKNSYETFLVIALFKILDPEILHL